jgi:hypothetical protein
MLAVAFLASAFGTSAAIAADVQDITIASAGLGGMYYPTSVIFAKLFNDKLQNVRATAQATGGSAKNFDILSRKEATIGYTSGLVANYSATGKKMFKGRDLSWVRDLTGLWPDVFQFVVTPDINSLTDLKGKRVAMGAVGGAIYSDAEMIFGALGLKVGEDIKPEQVGFAASADLLRDGHISGSMILGMPNATVIDLMSRPGFKILSLSDEEVAKIIAKEPIFTKYVIPANYYNRQPEAVHTVYIPNFLFVRAELDEKLVYDMVKAIYENLDELRAANKVFQDVTLENAPKGMPWTIHPGAAKYYKEKGVLK